MRIIIRPVVDPLRELDLTNRLISVIAEELWRLYGGNEQLNWLEAEQHLRRIVGEGRAENEQATLASVAGLEPTRTVPSAVARRPRLSAPWGEPPVRKRRRGRAGTRVRNGRVNEPAAA